MKSTTNQKFHEWSWTYDVSVIWDLKKLRVFKTINYDVPSYRYKVILTNKQNVRTLSWKQKTKLTLHSTWSHPHSFLFFGDNFIAFRSKLVNANPLENGYFNLEFSTFVRRFRSRLLIPAVLEALVFDQWPWKFNLSFIHSFISFLNFCLIIELRLIIIRHFH